MTKKDAKKIISLLKSGERYKKGHYHYGYVYYWYDSADRLFYYKMEDLSTNIFEPTIIETTFSEAKFLKKIINEYNLEDFANGGLSIQLPQSKSDLPKPRSTHSE